METAHLLDQGIARTDMEMIGIGELHLAADFLEIPGGERAFDGALGAHVHENGSLDQAVGRLEHAAAGAALLFEKGVHGKPRIFDFSLLYHSGRESQEWTKRKTPIERSAFSK